MARPANPEFIAQQIRLAIRNGRIPSGSLLNQNELASQLGVSRIPVREALRTLASEGLVELQPGRGARVVELNATDIADLYDLRLRLEPVLAQEIVDSMSQVAVRHLRHLAEEMSDRSDAEHWSTLNFAFHRRMYEDLERPHTIRIILQVMGLVEPYSRIYVHGLSGLERATREHIEMVDALHRQDAYALERCIRAHLEGAQESLVEAFRNAAVPAGEPFLLPAPDEQDRNASGRAAPGA